MRLTYCLLVLSVLGSQIELSNIIYGVLEGSRLIDTSSASECMREIYRESSVISFTTLISDSIIISTECKWETAAKALIKFESNQELLSSVPDKIERYISAIANSASENHRNIGIVIGKMIESSIASMSPYVLKFKGGFSEINTLKESPYPIAVFHGLGDCCCFPGMIEFTDYLAKEAKTYAKCIEIGDGPPASWLMAFQTQANTGCAEVKKIAQFANGINVVGLSQGALIARALAEQCNITVHNVISLGGIHMGTMTLPNCESGFYCDIVNDALDLGVYDPYVQAHIGPAGYFKDQYKYTEYLAASNFLAAVSNERSINPQYSAGFKAINTLVLIEFTEDTVVDPKESEQFGFYANDTKKLLAYNETGDYLSDILGLKTLDEQGKIVFEYIVGNHLEFNFTDVQKYVIPYLV